MVHALFPGSFDPVTLGHLDIVSRGLAVFQRLTVGVAQNIDKRGVFSLEERVAMLRECLPDTDRIDVCSFDGLVVDFCVARGIPALLRGIRSGVDFEYEYQMSTTNRTIEPRVETVFLITSPAFSFVSSSLIKDIAKNGGDVTSFVPESVARRLAERLA